MLAVCLSCINLQLTHLINFNIFLGGSFEFILGKNNSGKTTLMKILFGLIQPDEGKIVIDRAELKVSNPQVASAMGIGMVHQHFSLSPDLTVSENIVLGLEPTRKWLLYDYQKTY